MSDDWQDAAFSSRHMHNRNQRGSKSKRFDVHKTFGSYEIRCPAWQKLDNVSPDASASLEVYRLTENDEGVVCELALPGALRAAVVMAGSRESLRRTVEGFEGEGDGEDEEDDEDEKSEDLPESPQQTRFDMFEKNSFRSPKFWFRWNGAPEAQDESKVAKSGEANPDTGLGYIVFSGNDCRKFKGTINCSAFGWKDVAITGHKATGRSDSDIPVVWGKDKVAM
ncbi:hypothetical protein CC86DRAFT_39183 [Ophiobolus disseminans]|uniref:Uncharacterized protein n=1 Tax=Ophiobolus disseminans TaxID=1469910 RepID=A0A6A6ZW98_9PLEO|nr:hypothetical protein CC86DRAFT_39183 [Ophiobolus disseminans]